MLLAQTALDPVNIGSTGAFVALVWWIVKEQNLTAKEQNLTAKENIKELQKLREAIVLLLAKHDLTMPSKKTEKTEDTK